MWSNLTLYFWVLTYNNTVLHKIANLYDYFDFEIYIYYLSGINSWNIWITRPPDFWCHWVVYNNWNWLLPFWSLTANLTDINNQSKIKRWSKRWSLVCSFRIQGTSVHRCSLNNFWSVVPINEVSIICIMKFYTQ